MELAKWLLWNEVPLGLNIVYFGIVTTENNNRCRISMVGRSNCGKNSGYFLASNAVMMLKIKARPGYTRTKKGLKDWILMRMLTFGFAMMISVQKKPDGNKCDFCRFSMTLKMVTFVPVQIQMVIFQKALTFFCIYWISQFEGLSTQCSQLTVKAIFTRLRNLQCFKAV